MQLEQFCGAFKQVLQQTKATAQIIAQGQLLLQQLVRGQDFLQELFTQIVTDEQFYQQRLAVLDENEIFLYKDPDRLFTIKLFIWRPERDYPIHDHGSWGIVGCLAGELVEYKYERLDDGKQPYFAEIREKQRAVLKPGETTSVNPLNNGIHRVAAQSRTPGVSVHVYGPAIRKGYIQLFDLELHKVRRLYPPKAHEKINVLNALASMDGNWSVELLEKAVVEGKQAYEIEEAKQALQAQKE